jgi:superfamily II RNA helicase
MKFKTINDILKNYVNKENNIIKRPKNTIEMNKLLISSFALTQDRVQELSKKLYSINENFFNIMKEMKIEKTEMELKQLSQKKDKITPLTVELIKSNEKKWERKFLLKKYDDKMSEKEFKQFKKLNKIETKKDIKQKSKQLADNIMKMDAREYEKPDDIYIFKSTGGYVSKINIHRIRRVKKILQNIEDKEQLGAIDVNVEKLRKNQKKSEAEVLLAIKRSGKPRFVKTHFKESTIIKYKGASGEYFGVPA